MVFSTANQQRSNNNSQMFHKRVSRLTWKAEPPPTRDVNRDSGTDSANGGSGDLLGIVILIP
jgi:hypothetical protein